MNRIDKDELYEHLCLFLKTKGVEFHEGTYTKRIRQGCAVLTDTINLADRAVHRAKTRVDKTLSQVRQTIHEKTAPKAPPAPPAALTPQPPPVPPPSAPPTDKTASEAPQTARQKSPSPRSKRAKPSTRRRAR